MHCKVMGSYECLLKWKCQTQPKKRGGLKKGLKNLNKQREQNGTLLKRMSKIHSGDGYTPQLTAVSTLTLPNPRKRG